MTIVLDFDGTIIDYADRIYSVFVAVTGEPALDLRTFWDLKRVPRSNAWILENLCRSGLDKATFDRRWFELVEAPDFIAMDKLLPFARQAVETLARLAPLILLTARRSEDVVHAQLKQFDLDRYFEKVVVTGGTRSKVEAVRANGIALGSTDTLVGDSEADVATARAFGMCAVAVASGCRSRDYLTQLSPDIIFEDLAQFAHHAVATA